MIFEKNKDYSIGCYSKNPDKDKHNWPEYTNNEGGDEVSECRECGVHFFGFSKRKKCRACHMSSIPY